MDRADPEPIEYMQYYMDERWRNIQACQAIVYKDGPSFLSILYHRTVTFLTASHTEVTAKGKIKYSEVVRENVRKLEIYVEEMASEQDP